MYSLFDRSVKPLVQQRCCCGCCSLYTGASIALILSAVEALVFLLWNIVLLMLLNDSEEKNPLPGVINFHQIDNFEVVHGFTLAAVGLNGFWLLGAIFAGRGNTTLRHGYMAFWDILTYVMTLFDIGTTIYFAVKLQEAYVETPEFYLDSKPTKTLTYLTFLVAFSKGGVFLFFNIYLALIVQRRGKEIDHDHSALALYIISHIAHCNGPKETSQPIPEPPPSYSNGPPYYIQMPCAAAAPRSDSSGSQWSLSYDAIQNMSQDPPKYFSSLGANHRTPMALARALSRDPSFIPEVPCDGGNADRPAVMP